MKVKLLIVGQLPPPVHGSNIMTKIFLHSLQNIGHRVSIVQKTFSKRQSDVGNFSIIKLFKVPVISIKILHQIFFNKPDLCVYFISVKPPSFFVDALFLSLIRALNVKYVLYMHGKGLLKLSTNSGSALRFLIKNTLSNSLGALVLGENLKADVNRFISNERLFVLPNAIPDIYPEKPLFKCNLQNAVQVLFLSNLRPSKGTIEFLKMAKIVVEKSKGVKFILAGPCKSENFFNQIKDFIINKGLSDFIEVPGGIYGAEKEKYFRESSIFVFPTYLETFGLVNLEAMQWGLPIVSSNEGAIPEVVREGVNGYIVDPKNVNQLVDRVLRLVEDPQLRMKMGKAGREIYEKFYTVQAYEKRLRKAVDFFCRLQRASKSL